MRFFKKNDGFTLVELIVTIVVGSIAAMAAATVLILGLRIYNSANDTALKQNEIQIGITVIENLVAEAQITYVDNNKISAGTEDVLIYDSANDMVKTGAGVAILNNVTDYSATLNENRNLISFVIKIGEDMEEYKFSICCRLAEIPESEEEVPAPAEASSFSLTRTTDAETLLAAAVEDDNLTLNVRTFLNVLSSQRFSTGRIQTPEGEGEYYSEWYIGGYGDESDWNADTPWCACFVSWALEQCGGYLEGETPRYANVDTFWADLVTTQNWKTDRPVAGDLIFFDWIVDEKYNPQHIGVVIAADDSRVYTIEGNVNGRVVLCSYSLDDERILGYGMIGWTN